MTLGGDEGTGRRCKDSIGPADQSWHRTVPAIQHVMIKKLRQH